jgi:acetyltransferase-like isoleucine patch superfamily enzyme
VKKYFKHSKALVGTKADIGDKTRVWAFVNVQDGAKIGKACNVADHCFIEKGVVIGDHVTIKNGVSLFDGIVLGDDVFCGTNVVFVNDRRPRSHRKDAWTLEKTIVKKGATLGSNATILCGITIHEYGFVGAGSVVTKDVLPYTIVVGNPARPGGYACRCGRKLDKKFSCVCGLSYRQSKKGLILDA